MASARVGVRTRVRESACGGAARGRGPLRADSEGSAPVWTHGPSSRFKRVCRHLRKMAAWVDSLHFPLFQWFSQQCLCAPRKKERSRSFALSLSARLLCAYLHCGRSVYRPHGACSVFKMGKPREEVKWGKTENQANRAQIARLNWAPLPPAEASSQCRSGAGTWAQVAVENSSSRQLRVKYIGQCFFPGCPCKEHLKGNIKDAAWYICSRNNKS